MSASDAFSEISALVSSHDVMANSDYKEYSDSQSRYLTPVNFGSYSQQIVYDSRELIKSWWVPAHSYLSLPITIKSSTATPYTVATLVSFRESVLNLVSGIILNLNGQQLVNSNQTMFFNNLRRKLSHDLGWKDINDNELCSAEDEAEFKTSVVGRIVPENDVSKNAGLAKRVRYTKAHLSFNAGELKGTFRIPLAYLHPVFEGMDWPLINSQFQLTILLSTSTSTTGSQYPPVLVSGVADPPSVIVSNSDEPRLYYREVYFHGSLAQKLSAMLQSGISKKIYFTESELIKFKTTEAGTTEIKGVVSPSTIAPHRLFILSPAKDAFTASASNQLVGSIGRFKSFQATINNTPIFSRSLDTDYEQYTLLKDEFANTGSDQATAGYSFDKWKDGDSILCVNYTKHAKDKMVNSNASCSLAIDLQKDSGTPLLDIYCVLERKKHVILNMSAGGTTSVLGDGF